MTEILHTLLNCSKKSYKRLWTEVFSHVFTDRKLLISEKISQSTEGRGLKKLLKREVFNALQNWFSGTKCTCLAVEWLCLQTCWILAGSLLFFTKDPLARSGFPRWSIKLLFQAKNSIFLGGKSIFSFIQSKIHSFCAWAIWFCLLQKEKNVEIRRIHK